MTQQEAERRETVSRDQITEELERISALAQETRDPMYRIELWAQYRALHWVRSPTGFAAPSDKRKPEPPKSRAHLTVVRTSGGASGKCTMSDCSLRGGDRRCPLCEECAREEATVAERFLARVCQQPDCNMRGGADRCRMCTVRA